MSRIAAVLLAAGGSRRFGQPKQLLEWEGTPFVARIADAALAAGLDPVVVVTGCAAEAVQAALKDRPVQVMMNWRWQEGLSTSVRLGMAALPPTVEGAVFMPADQPLIPSSLLRDMVARFTETQAPIVHPVRDGQPTTPVLFARSLFPELAAVEGDQGGRGLVARYAKQAVRIEAPAGVLADVDLPADYERLRAASPPPSLAAVSHLIVDMDGVLWRGDTAIPGLPSFFDFLRQREISFILATNNASKRPDQYVDKLARLGVQVSPSSILTSAQATAAYLSTVAPPGTPVYAIGMDGLRDALRERGFELVKEGASYVAVGWTIDLTWRMLARAAIQIQAGAKLIGTNPDPTFPSEEGQVPGNGATLAALQAATGVAPLIIGKPEPWLYQEAMRRMGGSPETTAVIGDRLNTDIAGGKRLGLTTILVLSGITSPDDLHTSAVRPDLVYADIGEVTRVWREQTE